MGYDVSFLKKVFLKNLLISCVVWGFMIVQFWWGDHDWGYLKDGVNIGTGFFEVRYSQHLFTLLLLDGQVLPIVSVLSGIIALVMSAVLLAVYMNVPEKNSIFYPFVLLICLNPYVFIYFYYVYLALSFMIWPLVGICGLLLCEAKIKIWRFLLCALIWFLLFGSYPANFALILTVFSAKRVLCYCYANEKLKDCCKLYAYFGGQILLGGLGFKIIYYFLRHYHLVNLKVYNIQMRAWSDVLANVPIELVNSVCQLFHFQTFMAVEYSLLLFIPLVIAVFRLFSFCQRNLLILCILLLGVFLSSRFAFLIGENAEKSLVRLEYFGRLGLLVFAMGVLGREKQRVWRNFWLGWWCIALISFIKADLEIQKIQALGFTAGRNFQARLGDKIVSHPSFDMQPKYIAYSFGYPNFRTHYYSDKYKTGEIIGQNMVFVMDEAKWMFWEEKDNPIIITSRNIGRSILRYNICSDCEKWLNTAYWQDNPENIKNIRYWLYMEAKQNSVWVDDKYIILVLDMLDFYRHRELVLKKLDE